ncbi:hypothetical protein CMQ_3649 [Grosmannia clavigera kw1407]|uniref:Uncharacterized protein n=1 Tax=Grosmannia clavigera (strain kw1407 / UAMH 11150) TaxID=655863 RepID=F0X9V7_GROCL|nr:uncharacterized protein CMQ_3649 [Grosmannia clavigera kw1407]EFX05580.1 hypothetical protein CMQ_3649 [Grosmannia clavigera kw1407]
MPPRKRALADSDSNVGVATTKPTKVSRAANASSPSGSRAAPGSIEAPPTIPTSAPVLAAASAPAPAPAPAPGSRTAQIPISYRIPMGPNGEFFMPTVMPKESVDHIHKIPMPDCWVVAIDATPDHSMTLNSREWWEQYGVVNRKKNISGKLASLYPDHPCVSSVRGLDISRFWILETLKRDQDSFQMHVYNDFSLYGQLEVLQNILIQFNQVYERNPNIQQLWPLLESVALFLNSGFIDLSMMDDPEQVGAIIEMLGYMTMATIEYIDNKLAPTQDLNLPNTGFITAMLVSWAWGVGIDFEDWADKATWLHRVLQRADRLNVTLVGVPGIDATLTAIRAVQVPGAVMRKWTDVRWATQDISYEGQFRRSPFCR